MIKVDLNLNTYMKGTRILNASIEKYFYISILSHYRFKL